MQIYAHSIHEAATMLAIDPVVLGCAIDSRIQWIKSRNPEAAIADQIRLDEFPGAFDYRNRSPWRVIHTHTVGSDNKVEIIIALRSGAL